MSKPLSLKPTSHSECCDTNIDLADYGVFKGIDEKILEETNIKLHNWSRKYYRLYEACKFAEAKEYIENNPFILPEGFDNWVIYKNNFVIKILM